MNAFATDAVKQITRYGTFLRWFLSDSLARFRRRAASSILFNLLGVGFRAAAFGVAIYYAKAFAKGDLIAVGTLCASCNVDPRTSLLFLAIVGFSVFLAVALSSICTYLSKSIAINVSRQYIEHCMARAIGLLARPIQPVLRKPDGRLFKEHDLKKLLVGDSRLAGRTLRAVIDIIVPIVTALVSSVYLLYQDTRLTLFVFAAFLIYVAFQARVGRRAARDTKAFENANPYVTKKIGAFLAEQKTSATSWIASHSEQQEKGRSITAGVIAAQLDAFEGRIRIGETSRFVSGMFTALLLGILFFLLGQEIIHAGYGWGDLLVYLVTLQFATTGLQQTFGLITMINRLYPPASRYAKFVNAYEQPPTPCDKNFDVARLSFDSSDFFRESIDSIELAPGTRYAVVTDISISKFTFTGFLDQLFGKENQVATYILTQAAFISPTPVASSSEWVETARRSHRQRAPNVNPPMDSSQVEGQRDSTVVVLTDAKTVVPAGAKYIFVESTNLKLLHQSLGEQLRDLLKDRTLFVLYYGHSDQVGLENEPVVIVLDGFVRACASIDIYKDALHSRPKRFRVKREASASVTSNSDDDEDYF